ncbi:uncharacterized protein TRIADDRAFT_60436 [Trichoplax adhaerens]|uniref:Small integral membrane protein 15 n=1 Tax=Trichoplax adhaerens TaxID=10228 RepID=B3S875_TRIAD|nr:hypothetical protein TRIADDRAFT_60436 [Trichoplax adhaerens]EDV21148.1 hypothetical protein TRIADDRAFT_60436 [Trichoplax adhaerens]|eukprot:XP_002116478.1 hypothetical protein TRIADDRAFT_60436 [Trichoplax adhaerens]
MEYLDAIFQYFGYDNFHEFAFWVAKNPYEFLVSVMIVLTPMFIISGILAFYLLKAIEKDEKEKKKRGNLPFPFISFNNCNQYWMHIVHMIWKKRLQNIKQDQDQGDKPKETVEIIVAKRYQFISCVSIVKCNLCQCVTWFKEEK